ncbi:MAG TPA: hypothetical protein VK463_00330 [Desulfomonilaceae bacterium]|nr:hypothetical protein [Desulfomonilaceae bacterium]
MKILLGQLGANGDCLYATVLARQIKEDYPGCHLTWAISSRCKEVLTANPYVDEIWEWNVSDTVRDAAWRALETTALRIQTGLDPFDKVVLSQIWPDNFRRYDGTVRPSIVRAYDRPITAPVDTVIVLTDQELDHVEKFVRLHGIDNYGHRILIECSSRSGQSYVTPTFVMEMVRLLSGRLRDCCFILSSDSPISSDLPAVFSAHELGMRENAALTHYCSHFIGCGSGLTVVATSSAAKELPTIQVLAARTSVYASFFHDFEYWGKPTERFIEMGDASAETVADAIFTCCRDGLDTARATFHRPLQVTFDFYLELIDQWLVQRCMYLDALESLSITALRYGWNKQLLDYARRRVVPLAKFDALCMDPRSRKPSQKQIDQILAAQPNL